MVEQGAFITQTDAAMPDAQHAADLILIRRIAAGDSDALETLYQRYSLRVWHYLIGLLEDRQHADEVLQEVMLAVWKGAVNFRGESKVSTWLLAIAKNLAIQVRKKNPAQVTLLDEADEFGTTSELDELDEQAELERVRDAIRQLPAEQRETLELVFYHQLAGADAASVLGVAHGTVKSRLNRAVNALRVILKQEE